MRASLRYLLLSLVLILFLPILGSLAVHAQDHSEEIERNAALLDSDSIGEKINASAFLANLTREELGPLVLSKVKRIFERELKALKSFNDLALNPKITLDEIPPELRHVNREDWSEYFSNLCRIVAKLGDMELLPDLLDFKTSPREIIGYGEAALGLTIRMLRGEWPERKYSDSSKQLYAAQILVRFMEEKENGYVAAGETRKKIRAALIDKVFSEKSIVMKAFIVRSFGDLGDDEFVPVLEEIEKSDSSSVWAKADPRFDRDTPAGEMVERYPVRKTAREALEKIRQKKNR